jgi:chemotaxis protein histidine kinase CheA
MSDFGGMEELLQDFLQEAHDLLSDVDNKLVELEKMPDDRGLLNDIFRGFHTVKGGAGFLNASELVTLCHLTENLFDRLRNGELELNPELMDVIMAATNGVREMFGELGQMVQPQPADPACDRRIAAVALEGEPAQLLKCLLLRQCRRSDRLGRRGHLLLVSRIGGSLHSAMTGS